MNWIEEEAEKSMKIKEASMEYLDTVFNSPLGKWISAAIILVAGIAVLKIIVHMIRKILVKSSVDEALHKFMISTVKISLWIVIAVAVLSALGVNTSTFIAVIGAAGAAIAIALKDSLSNVAGGIIILVTKPFGKGDYVSANGVEGTVDEIDIMNTVLKTVDNKLVLIPNGTITSNPLINYTRTDARRVDFKVGVSYKADLKKVKEVLTGIADECEDLVPDKEHLIGVGEYGDSAVIFDFAVWTRPETYWKVKYYLGQKIKEEFDRENIEIPYAHIEVIIDKSEA